MTERWSTLIAILVVLALISGYVVYNREQERRLPRDFKSIELKITKQKKLLTKLKQAGDLATLPSNWAKLRSTADLFGIESKEKKQARRSATYKGKADHWQGELRGPMQPLLSSLKLMEGKVPLYYHQIRSTAGDLVLEFTVVGVEE